LEYTLVFRSVGKTRMGINLCPIIAAIHEVSGLEWWQSGGKVTYHGPAAG